MELTQYRESKPEQQRTGDLMQMVQEIAGAGGRALDVGARDGHFSRMLTGHFDEVVALDLEKPDFTCPGVTCVQGDITRLDFADDYFDFILCAEVLEHIPPTLLGDAVAELERVCAKHMLIGVPYKQDIRVGRTTCYSCGGKNPPWAHVNSFDEHRLQGLFPACQLQSMSFVGTSKERTNPLSVVLLDLAGNPYGTYEQDEVCVHCGSALLPPPQRSLLQKICTKAAFVLQAVQSPFVKAHGNWIHTIFSKT